MKTDGVLSRRGPTYKVVAEADGVQTRVLLDPSAQISLVCQELLGLDRRTVSAKKYVTRPRTSWSQWGSSQSHDSGHDQDNWR